MILLSMLKWYCEMRAKESVKLLFKSLHRQQLVYFFLYVVHTNTRSVTMSRPSERYLTHIRVAFFVPPELFCMRAVQ